MWAIACFLFLIFGLPAYLLKRGEYVRINERLEAQAALQQQATWGTKKLNSTPTKQATSNSSTAANQFTYLARPRMNLTPSPNSNP